ncbi:phage baseplate assembly protein V [Pseudochelatococcus lubricantis]|uniref:phage baseplate assembly protein V n=1 Tax=Pseudochelatococcus lubricantis TaxID=1538102 RepID=UPI0035E488BE
MTNATTIGGALSGKALPVVTLGGAPLPQAAAHQLSRLVIRRALNVPALAELTIEAPPPGFGQRCEAGLALAVATADGRLLFRGTITGQEQRYPAGGVSRLLVRAHDALHALRLRRRFRVVENARLTALWEEAAAELDFTFACDEETPPRRFVQAGTSDLAALLALGGEQGLYATLDGTCLRLVSLAGREDPRAYTWGKNLLEATIEKSGEQAARASRSRGWDPYSATSFSAEAALARQDQSIDLDSYGLPALEQDQGLLHATNRPAGTQAALEAQAQAAFDRAVARETVLRGTVLADPDLAPGLRLRLDGLDTKTSPIGVVTEVVHHFDAATGATSTFSTALPHEPEQLHAPVVTLGEVTDIQDPEGGARCKVKLPALGDLEPGFFSVLVAGAGAGKGAAVLPDVGDQVVVLFPQGDLAQGIILGGLYGHARLPRGTTTQDKRALVLASGGNQRLVLGGQQTLLSLSTQRGDLLQLGAASKLVVAGDLTIAAVGGTLTIQAARVQFERRTS